MLSLKDGFLSALGMFSLGKADGGDGDVIDLWRGVSYMDHMHQRLKGITKLKSSLGSYRPGARTKMFPIG